MVTMDWQEAKGWLTKRERETLHELSRRVNRADATIVNIGVQFGASIHCINAGGPMAYRVGIDIDMTHFIGVKNGASLIQIDSLAACEHWGGGGVDFLFVDGDHSYEGVKRDLSWTAHMKSSSYIMFHDCYDWPPAPLRQVHSVCPGVNQAVEEWVGAGADGYREIAVVNTSRVFGRGRYAFANLPA